MCKKTIDRGSTFVTHGDVTKVQQAARRRPVAASRAFFINQKVVFVCYLRIIGCCYRTAAPPATMALPLPGWTLTFCRIFMRIKT